jgi:hypothetical protein
MTAARVPVLPAYDAIDIGAISCLFTLESEGP